MKHGRNHYITCSAAAASRGHVSPGRASSVPEATAGATSCACLVGEADLKGATEPRHADGHAGDRAAELGPFSAGSPAGGARTPSGPPEGRRTLRAPG